MASHGSPSGEELLRRGANPFWSRAPFMLLRYPGLFVALAVGAMLLVIAAAAYPLFISASAGELLRDRIADPIVTPYGAGPMFRNGTMDIQDAGEPGSPMATTAAAFRRVTRAVPHLGPIVSTMLSHPVSVSTPDGDQVRGVRLFAGDGALDHILRVRGDATSGTWMPQLAADALGVGPGDRIVLSNGRHEASLVVDGVYRDIFRNPGDGYWRPWNDELVLYGPDAPPPPQPLIVEPSVFEDLDPQLHLGLSGASWQAPLEQGLSYDEALQVERALEAATQRANDATTDEGQILTRCYARWCNDGPTFGTSIREVVAGAERRLAAVESPASLLRVAGLLVALVVVAAAGAFAMAARRVEGSLLFARGTGPVTVGARAGLEALLPCVAGAVLGALLAAGTVRWLGPDGPIAGSATRTAMRAVPIGAVVAVLTIGVVSAVSFLRHSELHRARFGGLGKLPWELALIALAFVVLARLRSGGAVLEAADGTTRPSQLVLLFPVLFLAGFAALAARLLIAGLAAARAGSSRLPSAPFLAIRRLVATPQLTVLFVASVALCLGLFVEAQAMASSMRTTVATKAAVYVGSDVQARIDYGYESPPADFPVPFTRVTRQYQAGSFPGNRTFDLLAIDAETFARAAFWQDGFAQEPVGALVSRLTAGEPKGPLPVIVARPPRAQPTSITLGMNTLPIDVVGTADAFPGMSSLRPLVVVDRDRLLEAIGAGVDPFRVSNASTELWLRASEPQARDALATLPYVPSLVLTTAEVQDIPYISAVIDAFLVLNGLGLAAAFLGLAAIVMYLQARQRSQVVAYGLSLRMGMGAGGHRRAVAAELAAMLAVAALVGAALAIAASRLVVPLLDPLDAIPPEPISVVPTLSLVVLPFALALVVFGGAWFTERRARTVDLGQVMRVAD